MLRRRKTKGGGGTLGPHILDSPTLKQFPTLALLCQQWGRFQERSSAVRVRVPFTKSGRL
jgi:hypothetical protein